MIISANSINLTQILKSNTRREEYSPVLLEKEYEMIMRGKVTPILIISMAPIIL